ncbi:hypothetical protein C0995_016348 [Termitomyces sp. Mi166|nr:hypothetical protein C0995_016348 [Termitomyces sp. Mi166\
MHLDKGGDSLQPLLHVKVAMQSHSQYQGSKGGKEGEEEGKGSGSDGEDNEEAEVNKVTEKIFQQLQWQDHQEQL